MNKKKVYIGGAISGEGYTTVLLRKLVFTCLLRQFRLIVENPCTQPHYLFFTQNFYKPSIIDNDRTKRGDFFKKPTAYWFFGCEPTNLQTFTPPQ